MPKMAHHSEHTLLFQGAAMETYTLEAGEQRKMERRLREAEFSSKLSVPSSPALPVGSKRKRILT